MRVYCFYFLSNYLRTDDEVGPRAQVADVANVRLGRARSGAALGLVGREDRGAPADHEGCEWSRRRTQPGAQPIVLGDRSHESLEVRALPVDLQRGLVAVGLVEEEPIGIGRVLDDGEGQGARLLAQRPAAVLRERPEEGIAVLGLDVEPKDQGVHRHPPAPRPSSGPGSAITAVRRVVAADDTRAARRRA